MKLTAGQGMTLRDGALAAQNALTTAVVELNTIGDEWATFMRLSWRRCGG